MKIINFVLLWFILGIINLNAQQKTKTETFRGEYAFSAVLNVSKNRNIFKFEINSLYTSGKYLVRLSDKTSNAGISNIFINAHAFVPLQDSSKWYIHFVGEIDRGRYLRFLINNSNNNFGKIGGSLLHSGIIANSISFNKEFGGNMICFSTNQNDIIYDAFLKVNLGRDIGKRLRMGLDTELHWFYLQTKPNYYSIRSDDILDNIDHFRIYGMLAFKLTEKSILTLKVSRWAEYFPAANQDYNRKNVIRWQLGFGYSQILERNKKYDSIYFY